MPRSVARLDKNGKNGDNELQRQTELFSCFKWKNNRKTGFFHYHVIRSTHTRVLYVIKQEKQSRLKRFSETAVSAAVASSCVEYDLNIHYNGLCLEQTLYNSGINSGYLGIQGGHA